MSEHRSLCRRLVDYLNIHYPPIITIGRIVRWGLATLKRNLFGIGGIALLVIIALYVAGALIEPARWYLVGIASALLLLGGGLLALYYAKLWLDRLIGDQRKQVSDVTKALGVAEAGLKREIADNRDALAKMNVGNFPLFQRFNRRLTDEALDHFAGDWVPRLGLNIEKDGLGYMAHHICVAEDACIGRLAGDLEDMLLRILVARSVEGPELNVLEIGTLFGVSMAIVYENCKGFFTGVHITAIDPLQGYYGKPLDPRTMMPVTRDIFIGNMERMHVPKSDYTIIEKLSTEDEAIEQASKRRYNLLIIDGDHSYSGVKHDFFNYRHLVKRGGYVVFDNYNDPSCPEVADFVDKEVVGLPELELVGTDAITAVFRVISVQY